jgi:NAD(P)-dependent dehydrogenase (short-subunit alcohol dehydrogenase family)
MDGSELAIVTGASKRLGRAIAQALAQEGYTVGIHYYHSGREAEQVCQEIEAAGGRALALKADLRDESQIDDLFDRVASSGLRLKVLVNSAAVMAHGNLQTLSAQDWDETMALNLRAPWLCARRASLLMQAEGGMIVNITDAGAHKTWTGFPVYIVAKSALETLTRLLARSLAPNVRVNAIAPGLILPSDGMDPADWDRLVGRLPLQRSGDVQEIAATILFLLHNSYITGQTLVIDGGYQLV